jgi:glycosyltransferase involved in cell wall biosynthesis
VDDCSTDNTLESIKKFDDRRIRYICHVENRGVSAARNTGIKNSKGDFIAFLDSDDEFLPTRLEENLEVFAKSDKRLGLVCSNFWVVNKEDEIRKRRQTTKADMLWHIP